MSLPVCTTTGWLVHACGIVSANRILVLAVLGGSLVGNVTRAGDEWVEFQNETAVRLITPDKACSGGINNGNTCTTNADCPSGQCDDLGADDPQEKDYAWADVDQDGDIDLVCVRKQPFSTSGRLRNVLFMNEGIRDGHAMNGVLVDRTAEFVVDADLAGDNGFLTPTNDRDVALIDVNGDGWLDMVTAATYGSDESPTLPKALSHPRVYINKGELAGVWQGFRYEDGRIPEIVQMPNFCAVAAGDVTGDDAADLYFADYFNSLEDRLLINDGLGNFGFYTDQTASRTFPDMVTSTFSTHALIADMNGDGINDIVKSSALGPYAVTIAYNDSANEGFFDELNFDVAYTGAPYFTTVGDLNADDMLDLFVVDDGNDIYQLNQGNDANGQAVLFQCIECTLPGSSGFGGNAIIVDLNNDGFGDVLVTDVDVDIPGCDRELRIYRNQCNPPNVTFLADSGGLPSFLRKGTHDVAVFDINGDGWPDLVIGRCSGTQVWINQPPIDLIFSYPEGIPAEIAPGEITTFRVTVQGVNSQAEPDTGKQYVSIDNGPFVESPMIQQKLNTYLVSLGPVACTSVVRFYVSVDTVDGTTVVDPLGAPANNHSTFASLGTQVVIDERFETALSDWTVLNDPSLSGGGWERVDPVGTFFPDGSGIPAQPEDDFGAGADETKCYITGQHPGVGGAENNDVDGGPTTLVSPEIDLAGTDAIVSYARWMFTDLGTPDALHTEISNNGVNWSLVDSVSSTGGQWLIHSFKVSDYVVPSATVTVRFVVQDKDSSITEAGIDNFSITRFVCSNTCARDPDCVDGLFCNGPETCLDNVCQPGVDPCAGVCNEATDSCVDCLFDVDCDDGEFCTGPESCSTGACLPGSPPCVGDLVCDEVNDLCTGCLESDDCDDGSFCNGPEVCSGGNCFPAGSGVINGTFDGPDNWNSNIPVDGTITYTSQLIVVGPDAGTGGFTWASQPNVQLNGSELEFDLLSYASDDAGCYDYPVFYLDGVFYGLNADGTLGSPTAGELGGGGTINNDNQIGNVHFAVNLDALAGAGLHEIGLGVNSVDGIVGPGTAVFDNVLPESGPADPCLGQVCDELLGCVECVNDLHCNAGEHCCDNQCQAEPCVVALQPKMGDPLPGLTPQQMSRFVDGKAAFEQLIEVADGLGPIFNKDSCAGCHSRPIGGSGTIVVTRFGLAGKGVFDPLESLGGSLLQAESISEECAEQVPVEANVIINRLTNSTLGSGLVEAIPDADLLALQDAPPPNVSGRAHMMTALEDPAGSPLRVGRFGWKAQLPTVLSFSADASLNELGITSRLLPLENAPNGDEVLLAQCDTVSDPEDDAPEGEAFIDRVTDFQRFLAAPPQTPRSGMTGEAVFQSIGCANCHVPTFVTGDAPESVLSNKTIQPYSDFLLHDMGTLGDGIEQGDAATTEMRTPSLWGMRVRDPLLHDGRVSGGTFAERMNQIIVAHGANGSEAATSVAQFQALLVPDVLALYFFLDSLGRREFDHNGDDAVDMIDFSGAELVDNFVTCYDSGSIGPDNPCAVSDIDRDGAVTLADFDFFLEAFYEGGPPADCNDNAVPDLLEILLGEPDEDNNGVPDICEVEICNITADCVDDDSCTCDVCDGGVCSHMVTTFGNVTCDAGGIVDLDDLLCAIAGFGDPDACPAADIAGCEANGFIDLDDILAVIGAFGGADPCCGGG